MDTSTASEVGTASCSWIPLAAITIGGFVRLLKSDTPLPTVPKRFRPLLAVTLGIAAGVLRLGAGGVKWPVAIGEGLIAAALAIGGHVLLVERGRNGREFSLGPLSRKSKPPALPTVAPPLPPDAEADSTAPPTTKDGEEPKP